MSSLDQTRRFAWWHAGAALAVFAISTIVTSADVTIAEYHFDPGADFLKDSSANGYDLSGNAPDQSNDVANVDGGTGSAYFNGNQGLKTSKALDLTGVTHLRISYAMRAANQTVGILMETSKNFSDHPGALIMVVNYADRGNNGSVEFKNGYWHAEPFLHAVNNSAWDLYQVDITPAAGTNDYVQIWRNGSLQAHWNWGGYTNSEDIAFYSDNLYVGARELSVAGFQGNLDELKIESIIAAEPASGTVILIQ
jgi:hypothetical protein